MSKNKVVITGINTSNIKALKYKETNELFIKMKNGDLSARNKIVDGNLKLVLSILKKINTRNQNLDDLFQIGCVGLLKAIDNFDLSYNVKFSTYSVPMIEGEIKRYIRDNNSLRVSRSIKDLAFKTLKLKEELTMINNKEPSINDLSSKLNVSNYDLVMSLESLKDPVSIFEPIYSDGGDTIYLFDQIEDKSYNDKDKETKLAVNDAINNLNDRQKYVINQRFIIGKTQEELSKELGISQAQISRIEKGIINNIKNKLT